MPLCGDVMHGVFVWALITCSVFIGWVEQVWLGLRVERSTGEGRVWSGVPRPQQDRWRRVRSEENQSPKSVRRERGRVWYH